MRVCFPDEFLPKPNVKNKPELAWKEEEEEDKDKEIACTKNHCVNAQNFNSQSSSNSQLSFVLNYISSGPLITTRWLLS